MQQTLSLDSHVFHFIYNAKKETNDLYMVKKCKT